MVRPGGAEINPALRGTDGGAKRFRLGPAPGVRAAPGGPSMWTAPTTTAAGMSRVAGRRPYLGLRLACVVEVRNGDAGQALVDRPFDSADAALLFRRDQRKGSAGRLGTRRAADAVDVILRHHRHVEVD